MAGPGPAHDAGAGATSRGGLPCACSTSPFAHADGMRRRKPLYYGWVVALVGGAMIAVSAPGHTPGIVMFAEHWQESLAMTRVGFSAAWAAASSCSALLLPLAGYALDKFGSRRTLCAVAPLYVLMLTLISFVESPLTLVACLVALRFLGPECLVLIALTSTNRWFDRLRGRATAVLSLFDVLLLAAPTLFAGLIALFGYRGAHRACAAVFAGVLVVCLWLVRDTPHDHGLAIDGGDADADDAEPTDDGAGATRGTSRGCNCLFPRAVSRARGDKVGFKPVPVSDADSSECKDADDTRVPTDDWGHAEPSIPAVSDAETELTSVIVPLSDGDSLHSSGVARHIATDDSGSDRDPLVPSPTAELHAADADRMACTRTNDDAALGPEFSVVLRTPAFWVLCVSQAVFALFWAGFNVHSVDHLRLVAGLKPTQTATALYVPMTIAMSPAQMCIGAFVIDRLSATARVRALGVIQLALCGCMVLSLYVDSVETVVAFGVLYGLVVGASQAAMAVIFASVFGTRALGRVQAVGTALGVGSTGLGPVLFGLCRQATGSYTAVVVAVAACTTAAALVQLWVAVPAWELGQHRKPRVDA